MRSVPGWPRRRWAVSAAVLASLALTLAACGSGSPSATSSTTTTAAGVVSTVRAAIAADLLTKGVQPTQYRISVITVARTDPAWAYFTVAASAGDRTTFQGFYGFAHRTSTGWQVAASGSAQVGCPPGAAGNELVPGAVLSEFGLTCPPAVTAAPTPVPGTTTTAPPTTTTTSAPSPLTTAVIAFETSQGVPRSSYQVNSVVVSTVDASWAKFTIGPTAATATTFQGGYGYLHQTAGTWAVTGFGTAEVGCSTGATAVPAAVLAGFGTACPTGS
jgi:hypothetical protein